MKLRLNLALRRCVLAACALAGTLFSGNTAEGGTLHSQVSIQTYTDFGQNTARYRAHGVNALLSSIRARDNGVVLTYTGGQQAYTLLHPMISFEGMADNGASTAIGYNFLATVQHNGVQNPAFTANILPNGYAVRYYGIEYRSSDSFLLTSGVDYKITRLSKLVTDVAPSAIYTGTAQVGDMIYRAGSGTMTMRNTDGEISSLAGAYQYVTGGITSLTAAFYMDNMPEGDDSMRTTVKFDFSSAGISSSSPLPFNGDGGDSGSPLWIWNSTTRRYEYLSAAQAVSDTGGRGTATYCFGASEWSQNTMDAYSQTVNLAAADSGYAYVSGSMVQGASITEDAYKTVNGEQVYDYTRVGEKWSASVTDAAGQVLASYNGVKSGVNTWFSLSELKDIETWYAYDNSYLNVDDRGNDGKMSTATLFRTENLVFTSDKAHNDIVIDDSGVDLGVGYARFSRTDNGAAPVSYTVSGGVFNHAGYIVDAGVELHMAQVNSDAEYMREWRKVGEGDLYLEGSGNNEIFLNLGGLGTTYLQETGGYAAYNVLAGSGATVVLQRKNDGSADLNQIARDFTFGAYGGTLDFNGNAEMDWYLTNTDPSAVGFSINALSEDAYITNSAAGTQVQLTYRESGHTDYLGSFTDSAEGGTLRIVYDAGDDSHWVLNGIHTDLSHQADSGFTVASGTAELAGTHTVHAMGSAGGRNTKRYFSDDDWHYADAKMNVTVEKDATFTLGSHARLTGNVTVEERGKLIINEGTNSRYEYIEGGYALEDTESAFYSAFYGLKGNISLTNGALEFRYGSNVSSHNVYSGNISGTGSLLLDLGTSGAVLTLSGDNRQFTPGKITAVSGGIIAEGAKALGSGSNMLQLQEKSWLGVKGCAAADVLPYLSFDSEGVLALTQNESQQTELGDYHSLFIGAIEGGRFEYGLADTNIRLTDHNDRWLLGGGGGELVVNFVLDNENGTLVLGNEYTTGAVTLTNTRNHFKNIDFAGRVTLNYSSDAALGGAAVNLSYTNRVAGSDGMLHQLTESADGVMLLDSLGSTTPIDLSAHPSLHLGAASNTSFSGQITVNAGEDYRFGGITGTLTLTQQLSGDHGLSVDAQTFSGGVLALQTPITLTGQVTVMGYDAAKLAEDRRMGNITLRLDAENALASAACVTLKDGGILDISGREQTLHNLNTENGAMLTDSAEGRQGVLTVVQETAGALQGVIDVARLVKSGSGALSISGASSAALYDVQAGTLRVSDDAAMADVVTVRNGAVLATAGMSTSAVLNLQNGATVAVDNGETLALTNLPLIHAGDTATIKGNLAFHINEDMRVQGTLHMDGSAGGGAAGLALSSAKTSEVYTREFDHIDVADGTTLTISQAAQTMPAQFIIHELSGSGNVEWKGANYHAETPAYYILDGADSFSGNLKFVTDTGFYGRSYGNIFVLKHDEAAAQANLQLQGWQKDSGMLVLGIDTENARVKGLETMQNTGGQVLLMAGSAAVTTTAAPVSTRRATLTITGAENKTYSGSVAGGEQGNGLSLVMQGSAKQTFNGNSVILNNVSAQSGTLELLSKNLDIRETAEIYRGATLNLGSSYTLAEGHTLAVGGSHDTAATAVLSSDLHLAGGALSFDVAALDNRIWALETGALSKEQNLSELTVCFTDTRRVQEGFTYILAGGDWGSLGLNYIAGGADYYDADFRASFFGLTVTFNVAADSTIWNGTEEAPVWSSTAFGQRGAIADSCREIVFNDFTAWHQVQIDGALDYSDRNLIFDTAEPYTLRAEGGNSLITGNIHSIDCSVSLLGDISVAAGKTVNIDNGDLILSHGDAVAEAESVHVSGALHLNDDEGTVSLGANISSIGSLVMDGAATYDLTGAVNLNRTAPLLSGNDTTVILGDFSFDGRHAEFGGTVTANDLNISAGELRIGGGLAAHEVSVSGGQTHLGGQAVLGSLTTTGGTLVSNADFRADSVTIDGGNISFAGSTVIGDGRSGNYDLIINRGSASFCGETTVNGDVQLGNDANATIDKKEAVTFITIAEGASLSAGKLNSAWGFKQLTVDGILTAAHLNLSTGTTNTVVGSGTINTDKLTGSNNGTYKFSGVRLNIGSGGIDGARPIIFTDMTVGATADWTATRALSLGGNVTFNTALYDTASAQEGDEGTTITLGGALQAASGVNLQKTGSGTLKLNGHSPDFHGNIAVQGGTLELADSGILTQAGSIATMQGGSLKLDSVLELGHRTISNSGTLLYGENAYYALTEQQITTGGTYRLSEGSGSISGLSSHSFVYNNRDITSYAAGLTVDLQQQGGSAVLVISGTPELNRRITWNGSDGAWDLAQSANWLTEGGQSTKAYGDDNLVFNGGGSNRVSVASGVYARSYSIESGSYTFSGMGNIEQGSALNIAAGAAASVDTLASFSTAELGGELTLRLSGDTTLQTAINASGETRGTLRTEGSGTLTVSDNTLLPSLLAHVSSLTAASGTQIMLGADRMTLGADNYATSLTADGGTLNISVVQNENRTFNGNLSIINGGTLRKADGGIAFNGTIVLGASAEDSVTLTGNWGKGGIMLNGAVSGNGLVNITSLGFGNPQKVTLSHADNSFAGTYKADNDTQLILNAGSAAGNASVELNGGTLVLGADAVSLLRLTGSNGNSSVIKAEQQGSSILTITQAEGSYSGSVGAGISLVKQGSGTFTLAGDSANFDGNLTISSGTLKIGNATALGKNDPNNRSITVEKGAALDICGYEGAAQYGYTVTLNGGTLTNSGNEVNSGKRQVVTKLKLTADSEIETLSSRNFGLIAHGWGETAIELNDYTLNKKGEGTYFITNTDITGSGRMKVSEGTLQFDAQSRGTLSADMELAGGKISGNIKLGSNVMFDITGNAATSALVDKNAHALTLRMQGGTKLRQDTNNLNADTLLLVGSEATLQTDSTAGGITIGKLDMSDREGIGRLNLVNNGEAGHYSVFNIGGDTAENAEKRFRGTIALSVISSGQWSSTGLILNSGANTQDARIDISSSVSSTANLLLGIQGENITIAGLSSAAALENHAIVFNGTITPGSTNYSENSTAHTLTINTGAGVHETFCGNIYQKINLVKDGEGTQTLALSGSSFNGSINAKAGTLELSTASAHTMFNAADSIAVAQDAVIDLSGTTLSGGLSNEKISGSGTIILSNTQAYSALVLGNSSGSFTGTTFLKQGWARIDNSRLGNTLHTGHNVQLLLWADSTLKNVLADGDLTVFQDIASKLSITDSLSGEGTYVRRGNGNLTIDGTVDLKGGFLYSNDNSTTNRFNNTTKLGSYTVNSAGTFIFAGETSINTAGISHGTTHFNNSVSISELTIAGDSAEIKLNSGENSTSSVSIKAQSGQIGKTDGALNMGHTEQGELYMQGDAEQGGTLIAGTLIDLAAGTTLHLKDVVLADSSRLTDAPGASVDMTNVTVQAVKGSNFVAAAAPVTLESGSTLTANGNSGATIAVAATTSCNSFTLGNIDSLHLTGDSMTIALSGYSYEELLGLNKMLSITLGDNADFDNTLQVLLTVGSAEDTEHFYTLLGYHQGDGGSGTLFFDLSATIPEPTTGTLSLLALAALAARRRRKG